MRGITTLLVLSGLFMGIAHTKKDKSVECQAKNDNWVVHLNNGISYFYMSQYNAIVVVNVPLQYMVIIDGTNGTLSTMTPNTGYGGIINLKTNLVYAFYEQNMTWDLSGIADGDYSVIDSIIEVTSQYTEKVVADNIDTTQLGYADSVQVLRDHATTEDVTQWVSFQGQTQVIERMQRSRNSEEGKILSQLLQSGEYNPEWGPVMYLVVVTEMYKLDDSPLLQFNQFIASLVQTKCGKFTAKMMSENYKSICKG